MSVETLLIDTSIWVRILRGSPPFRDRLASILATGSRVAICGPIQQELLSGRNERNTHAVDSIVHRSQIIHVDPIEDFVAAGELVNRARVKGQVIRSAMDALIAQVAIRSEIVLIHNDKDYLAAATVSTLRQVQWSD
jgi:predicted nucleic acid-binding protein